MANTESLENRVSKLLYDFIFVCNYYADNTIPAGLISEYLKKDNFMSMTDTRQEVCKRLLRDYHAICDASDAERIEWALRDIETLQGPKK